MTVIRTCFWLAALVAAARLFDSTALAQAGSDGGNSTTDRAVQAFLAGNNAEAESLVARAAQQDPRDPLPHYLRALCLSRQGHPVEARAEMLHGAELEARAGDRYPVGTSLRLLPLADRLALDEFRWQAGIATSHSDADVGQATRPIATDAAVLRQKVAVRLDQLVRPVSLSELASAAAPQPAALTNSAEQPTAGDPFADDQPGSSQGKIPSGKLMGIVGRALLKSTPAQSLEAVREKISDLSLPGNSGAAAPPPVAAPAAADAAPTGDDPFAEPSPPPAEQQNDQQETESNDEDPFG
jgi:hypothetical protein